MNQAPETKNKLERLGLIRPILAAMPYTRIIFLAGSVARNCPRPESDIDLIIVSRHRRVWLNRFFLELATRITGQRRSQKKIKNKICLNVFLSHKNPALPHQDAVAAEMYRHLKPIWSRGEKEIQNFWQKNDWLEKFADPKILIQKNIFKKKYWLAKTVGFFLETALEFSSLGFWLEKLAYKFQTNYLKNKFAEKCAGEKSQADFFITPDLIAYHFPISNYSRALEKHKAKSADVEKPNS